MDVKLVKIYPALPAPVPPLEKRCRRCVSAFAGPTALSLSLLAVGIRLGQVSVQCRHLSNVTLWGY